MENRVNVQNDQIDLGLRSYLIGVYNHMSIGLLITALTAYFVGPEFLMSAGTMLKFAIILAPLAFVIFLSTAIDKLSPAVTAIIFYVFAALMGLSLTSIFAIYTDISIIKTLFISVSVFASASIYGYMTPKDLTSWSAFLFMGLIGIIVAGLVNLFLASTFMAFVVSCVGVIVFTGFTAYDTQHIKNEYLNSESPNSIHGALRLYLDFVNLFINLLQLFGDRK